MTDRPHPTRRESDTLIDCVADGVFTVDVNWKIRSFNKAAEEITGHRSEDVIGLPCKDVFKASICNGGCALRSALEHEHPVMMRAVYITGAGGERIPVCISASVLKNDYGEVTGAVETFRDLTRIEMAQSDKETPRLPRFIGRSPAMERVFELTPCVAETDSTVLIEGESGTGKELVARAVHELSSRRNEPLVVVNCGALPDTLLESELFGHRAGSFTDAKKSKLGRFELAQGGTIFLDEIGDVSPALQVRLLRVLQERVIEPLGSTAPIEVDVRVISATNKSLAELVEEGSFRKDLYYRVNVIKVSLPPLRDRREDIPLLVDHFIELLNEGPGRQIEGVAPEVMEILLEHDYPGNVRELQNILEHAAVLCPRGVVTPTHLPENLQVEPVHRASAPDPMVAFQKTLILSALDRHSGNRRAAADELGIHPTTLWRRAQRLGIDLPDQDGRSHPRA